MCVYYKGKVETLMGFEQPRYAYEAVEQKLIAVQGKPDI